MEMKKVLFAATLVKNHMMEFHLPYLQLFKDLGWEVSVAAKNDYDNPADCRIPSCDHFYDLPFQRAPLKPDNFRAWQGLRALVKEQHYDLIHCHTPVGAMVARLAALGTGTKVVYTAHGFHFYKGAPLVNWLVYFPVEWVLSFVTDVLITINLEDQARARKLLHAKKIVYIPGVGIHTGKFASRPPAGQGLRSQLNIPEHGRVLLSVGDLNSNKNHRTACQAVKSLGRQDLYYIVCGRGPMLEEHRQWVRDNGLEGNIFFLGYRDDMADIYSQADGYLFPSFREGLSVSVMEAMAAGLPILCSRIRGNTDLVEEGVNGFLVDPADPSSIARAITAWDSREIRQQMAENNRQKARDYDLTTIRPQYRRVYEELLGDLT